MPLIALHKKYQINYKDYSSFSHPDRSWIDIGGGIVFYFFLPFRCVVPYRTKQAALVPNQRFRRWFLFLCERLYWFICKAYQWRSGGKRLVCMQQTVLPQQYQLNDILTEPVPKLNAAELLQQPVPVKMILPNSMVPKGVKLSPKPNSRGFLEPEQNMEAMAAILQDTSIPLLVYIHGGGLTAGSPDDVPGYYIFSELLLTLPPKAKVVMCSIGYTLSPEASFPTAVLEVLTAVQWIYEQRGCNSSNMHLMGQSAGGLLSAVLLQELVRRQQLQPDTTPMFSSYICQCPMIHPDGYKHNGSFQFDASIVPAAWLKWCWDMYLEGSKKDDASLQRLLSPLHDIPSAFPPTLKHITVITNRADCLHDEGCMYVQSLRERSEAVEWLDHPGSHVFGSVLFRRAQIEFVETMKRNILGE